MPLVKAARRLQIAAVAAAAIIVPATVNVEQWPDRPVKLIVPIGAGGFGDSAGRYLAQQLGEQFKQSFFVENRPEATGVGARAAPDGYTLLVAATQDGRLPDTMRR